MTAEPVAWIGRLVEVVIDRPAGSRHPTHGFGYPLNYGYLPGVPSQDGEDLDAYVLGPTLPLERFTGRVIAVIRRLDDADDKLVVAAEDAAFSDEDIRSLTHFQEQFFTSILLRG